MAAAVPQHWTQSSWEDKARENPLFAVMTTPEMADAGPTNFDAAKLAQFFEKGGRLFQTHLMPLLQAQASNALIVEYGCGAGRILKSVAEAGYRCAGIDISETMLKHCRALVPQVTGLSLLDEQGRSTLADGAASLVYSYAVVQHIALLSSFCRAIGEMCRLLQPGGAIAVQVNCKDFADGDLKNPGRTDNFETYSLHYKPGSAEAYYRHEQDQWSGVYIGHHYFLSLLQEHGVSMDRWYFHNPKRKLHAVWYVGKRAN